jgi:hypothetical protein
MTIVISIHRHQGGRAVVVLLVVADIRIYSVFRRALMDIIYKIMVSNLYSDS